MKSKTQEHKKKEKEISCYGKKIKPLNKQSSGIVFIAISLVLDGRHSLRDLHKFQSWWSTEPYLIPYKVQVCGNFWVGLYTMILYGFQSCTTCILPWITCTCTRSIVLFNWLDETENTSSLSVCNRMMCRLVRCGGLELTNV